MKKSYLVVVSHKLAPTMDNYDYIQHTQGPIYTVVGDNHPSDAIFAFPCFIPDPNGKREFQGENYRRLPRIAAQWLRVGSSSPSSIDHNVVKIPSDEIAKRYSSNKPITDGKLHPRAEKLREFFADILDKFPCNWSIVGSDRVGLSTRSSDLDILVQTRKREAFERIMTHLQRLRDGSPPKNILNFIKRREIKRFGLSKAEMELHLTPKRRQLYMSNDFPNLDLQGDRLISFLPSQPVGSWSNFPLPDSRETPIFLDQIPANIHSIDKSHAMPRLFEVIVQEEIKMISSGTRIDVITYHWPYSLSFDCKDEILISGDYFPENNVIYVRFPNHNIHLEDRRQK